MKQYQGVRTSPGYKALVYVDGELLSMLPSKMFVYDYAADSLEWGYGGSGPSQTAAAILYDFTRDAELTKKYHQNFKRAFIQQYDQDEGFTLLGVEIQLWLDRIMQLNGGNHEQA